MIFGDPLDFTKCIPTEGVPETWKNNQGETCILLTVFRDQGRVIVAYRVNGEYRIKDLTTIKADQAAGRVAEW